LFEFAVDNIDEMVDENKNGMQMMFDNVGCKKRTSNASGHR